MQCESRLANDEDLAIELAKRDRSSDFGLLLCHVQYGVTTVNHERNVSSLQPLRYVGLSCSRNKDALP